MYKGIYAEKKTFSKFDNEHYLCYLNEQREEYSPCLLYTSDAADEL